MVPWYNSNSSGINQCLYYIKFGSRFWSSDKLRFQLHCVLKCYLWAADCTLRPLNISNYCPVLVFFLSIFRPSTCCRKRITFRHRQPWQSLSLPYTQLLPYRIRPLILAAYPRLTHVALEGDHACMLSRVCRGDSFGLRGGE
jgi:hypothetical protein